MASRFLNNITINDQYTLPETDGSADQIIKTNGAGQLSFLDQGDVIAGEADKAKSVTLRVKNSTASPMTKGQVVCEAVSATPPSGNLIEVALADNNGVNTMPALGILNEDLDAAGGANDEGDAIMFGKVSGIDTSAFSVGDEVFVDDTPGGLTTTKPTGVKYIQKVGVVIRDDASNGTIEVFGAGRVNDVPTPLYIDHPNQRLGIGATSPLAKLDINGNFRANTNNLTLSSTPSWGVPTQNIIGAEDNTNGATLTLMNTSATIPAGGVSGTLQFVALDDARNNGGAGYATASISAVSTSAPGSGTSGQGNLIFKTSAGFGTVLERMRVNSSGVGIGTTNPSQKLHVAGNARVTGAYYDSNNSPGTTNQVLVSTVTGTDWVDGTAIPGLVDGTGAANYVARWTGTESIGTGVIYDNGTNVGISATSLYSRLHIGNSFNVNNNLLTMESSGPVWAHLKTSSSNQAQIGFGDNQYVNQNTRGRIVYNSSTTAANNYMSFTTNFAEVMRITNSSVGIGITGPAYPSVKLHIGSASSSGSTTEEFRIQTGTGGGYGGNAVVNLNTGAFGKSGIYFGNNGSLSYANQDSFLEYDDYSGETKLNFGNTLTINKGTSSAIYIDSSSNVGIGTTSPVAKLEVEGGDHSLQLSTTSSTGSPYVSFNQAGARRSFIQHTDSGDFLKLASEYGGISFFTGTGGSETQKMTILSGGNVGIGTTDPNYMLHLGGATVGAVNGQLAFGDVANVPSGLIQGYRVDGSYKGELRFLTSASGGTVTQRMVIDENGDVGIGTTSPGQKLHVVGNARVTGAYYDSTNSPGTSGQILSSTATGTDWIDGISTSGFTMDDAAQIKTYQSTTSGSSQSAATLITENDITIGGCINWWSEVQNGSFGTYNHAVFYHGTSQAGSIRRSGNTSVSYNTSSDYRLKENVVEITDGIERLKQLKPSIVYDFILDDRSIIPLDSISANQKYEIRQGVVTQA